jgi:hypothetical protein
MSETDKPTIVEAGEPVSIEEAFAAPELCVWQQYLTRLFGQIEWKQYSTYSIKTDPDQDDKATEIKLCSFARPHMRASTVLGGVFSLPSSFGLPSPPFSPKSETILASPNRMFGLRRLSESAEQF